jgi:hypothetical protein
MLLVLLMEESGFKLIHVFFELATEHGVEAVDQILLEEAYCFVIGLAVVWVGGSEQKVDFAPLLGFGVHKDQGIEKFA